MFESDAGALENLRDAQAKREAEEAEVAYSARIGLMQTEISIDARHIKWGDAQYDVGEISGLRWGGTRHSVNGIPTGTTYAIAFMADPRVAERRIVNIETRSEDVYAAVNDRLWRLCGIPIVVAMLQRLGNGAVERIGEIEFGDNNVTLNKQAFFGKAERRSIPWRDARIWSADGYFYVGSQKEKGFSARASYRDHWNTVVLSNLLHIAFKRGIVQLSKTLS
jgi:hypothetical protein